MLTIPLISAIGSIGLGLIFGSFLNALSFRFHTGTSITYGRSKCMRCGHTLSALDLVPVLSYLALRGRCRYCGTRISFQYPLVEALAGAISLGVFLTTPEIPLFIYWFVVWMLILFIVVYDIRHTIIPWSCSLPLIALAFAPVAFSNPISIESALAGPVLAAPLLFISLISRGTWMGWGDGVFELALGWLLGLSAGLSALLFSVWIGAFVGIALVIWAQRPWKQSRSGFTMGSELPFAPFLALGAALCYFFHVDLFSHIALLW